MLERIKERLWGGGISMKLPLFFLFLMTGFFPMYILGKVTDQSFRQTQIDSRVMEVQNQCLIISNRMSRSGYMSEESRDSSEGETAEEIISDAYRVMEMELAES